MSVPKSVYETQEIKTQLINDLKNETNETLPKLKSKRIFKEVLEVIYKDRKKYYKLIRFAQSIKKGLRADYDFVCTMSGREGRGKSTLLIILAGLIDGCFSLEKNMSMLPDEDDIKKMFKKTRRYGVLAIDEAIRSLHKQDWYSSIQKDIVRMYATERFQNKATFMAIPRFKDLNENFRNHRTNCWIHVLDRGLAFIYVPCDIAYFKDPWNMEEMEKRYIKLLKRKKGNALSLEDYKMVEQNNPTFVGVLEFPDLPESIKLRYLDLKIRARMIEDGKVGIEISKDKIRNAVALKIYNERSKGVNNTTLAEEFNLSKNQITVLNKEGKKIFMKNLRKKQAPVENYADNIYSNN